MGHKFFLGSVLPPLKVGIEPPLLFEDLLILFRENLKPSEMKKVRAIRLLLDLKNVEALVKKAPIDPRGNITEKELDEALVNQETLPPYLFELLDNYETAAEQLAHFEKVYVIFFKEMEESHQGFLRWYFSFERDWRIILAGYRAKKLGGDLLKALQYENPSHPLVAQVIAQKDAPFFEFPFEYADLGEKIEEVRGDPMEQYLAMAKYRFKKVEEKVQDHPFAIDLSLGYMVMLMIVEDAYALDEKKGQENLNEVVKGNL